MIALIPARGGSKGLPQKNIKLLAGKPLIVHTIDIALKSKFISEIIVSTDDKNIAEIARKAGALIPFLRPEELASDTAMAIDNYIYTVDRLNNDREAKIDEIIILQPTSPLRSIEDVDGSIELFKSRKADSVVTYCEEHHPISWHRYINDDYTFTEIFDSNVLKNRQDNNKTFYPNGAVYIFNLERTLRKRIYYTSNSFAYIMPRQRSIDIDNLEDFEYAEFILSRT